MKLLTLFTHGCPIKGLISYIPIFLFPYFSACFSYTIPSSQKLIIYSLHIFLCIPVCLSLSLYLPLPVSVNVCLSVCLSFSLYKLVPSIHCYIPPLSSPHSCPPPTPTPPPPSPFPSLLISSRSRHVSLWSVDRRSRRHFSIYLPPSCLLLSSGSLE